MMFIAQKTEDGGIKGRLSFYCRMLHVTRQGFCKYLANRVRPWKYQALLLRQPEGVRIPSERTVYRVMEEIGLSHRPRRKPGGITKADREAHKSDDLLKRDFTPSRPLQKCVTDITQIKAKDGKLYVSAIFDCFGSGVLGLAMDDNTKATLCKRTLENAVCAHPELKGAIIHSDRGAQYTSEVYRRAVARYGIIQSMNSAGGRCHDNARCESMWARMKEELLYGRYDTESMTIEELKTLIWRYFISYWNNRRICSANEGGSSHGQKAEVLCEYGTCCIATNILVKKVSTNIDNFKMGKSLKGKELGKGITQRKDGLYQARFINRFGKRQTIYAKTYNDIAKKLRDSQYEDEKQLNVVNSNMTLDEWYAVWLETCKMNCRDTTKRTYATQYNRLREELGWRKLANLNLVIIQNAFNHLKTDSSRRDCKAVLVDMLNRAVEADLLNKNVAQPVNAQIECKETVEKRVLTTEEIQLLYQSSKDSQLYPFFVLALNTGMRIGEMLGLTWDCVDFESGIIHVEKTLCYLPNNGKAIYEFHVPKTKAGKRNIPMSKQVREVLQVQKAWVEDVNTRFPPQTGFEDLVFISKTNHPLHESNIRTAILYLINRINEVTPTEKFERFTPHCLRHTFATNCIAKGMRPKTLQKLLGHNSLQMTMDLYCHVLDETLKEEMAIVTEMV